MEKSLAEAQRDRRPAPASATSPHPGATTSTPRGKSSGRFLRYVILGLILLAVAGVAAALAIHGLPDLHTLWGKQPAAPAPVPAAGQKTSAVELVEGTPHTLLVPGPVREALGIDNGTIAQSATRARPLVLPGSTALDPTRIMRIRTRFNAEVVEISQVAESALESGTAQTVTRELRSGDGVKKGDATS